MSKQVALRPRASEKTYAISEALNTYVFDIPADTNKHAIARAVASQFDVTVRSVRITSIPGKQKRNYRKRGRNVQAQRSDIRKAYVTLAEGDKLPIFQAVETDAKTEESK